MTIAPWPPADRSSCEYCGAHVTDRFRRVFGDDDDRAHRCNECDSYRRLSRGSAAGKDVETPDPETSPGRHGGEADA
ncbi:small CPxCG-related zinc finger protein [Natrialba magadii ATCC 43099]|uniref:Small CPxCG-related zinc finger protein n=1 Tax=Natrialba magadii (strain ATCC 43099 / DSM 3394 / CCM 3739 / CIP 104546 / IAM 13178 / JCM 8861 / NBRC 102185 / NCIMB 2190 / MS3) TaxID=547559 RepID=A0A1C9J6Z5_NATMM|nr:small CPxCG-related zinc finger protein [Natrialba magadii ATCC 43099]